jgi:hypothetical protein
MEGVGTRLADGQLVIRIPKRAGVSVPIAVTAPESEG